MMMGWKTKSSRHPYHKSVFHRRKSLTTVLRSERIPMAWNVEDDWPETHLSNRAGIRAQTDSSTSKLAPIWDQALLSR